MTIAAGPIFQLGWVVPDITSATAEFADRYGVTEWFALDEVRFGPRTCRYRGRPADYTVAVALGYAGGQQLELIAPRAGDSPYSEYLTRSGAGLHHIAYIPDDFDAALAEARAAGTRTREYSGPEPYQPRKLQGRKAIQMRFTYAEAMTDPSYYVPLAQAAEAAGYSSITVADSIAYPKESDSTYPYTPDGNREFLEDKPFVEAFVLSAAILAATTTLRVTPFVVKLPIRPPVLVAKQAASLAAMSNNRFGFGVGISPWPDDFEIMGVPFEKRGARMDECIDIVRGLCAGGYFEFHGEFYDLPPIKINPVSTEPVPILIGGHSKPALRRAAQRGDGWMHAGGDPAELDRLLAELDTLRAEYGTRKDFEVHVISLDGFTVDGIKRLEDKGITDVIVGFRNPYTTEHDTEPLDVKIRNLTKFAERVIAETGN